MLNYRFKQSLNCNPTEVGYTYDIYSNNGTLIQSRASMEEYEYYLIQTHTHQGKTLAREYLNNKPTGKIHPSTKELR